MKAFEIHTFQEGRWKIDSVFDDRELALFEARRVDQGTRYSGVRVIEETYDETSDLTTTRTIFRGGNADRQEKLRKAEAEKKAAAPRRGGGKEPGQRRRPRKKEKSTNYLVPILILAVLIFAGLSALLGLQQLSQLR